MKSLSRARELLGGIEVITPKQIDKITEIVRQYPKPQLPTLSRAKKLLGDIKIITQEEIDNITEDAKKYSKHRLPILLNKSFSEIPQRFVNCLTKRTYVRPHNHVFTDTWELMSWLSGTMYVIFFDDDGNITHKIKMCQDGLKVIEIPSDVYHTFITPDFGSYLEIRNCAYEPDFDRKYASWAPPERSSEVSAYLETLFYAEVNSIENTALLAD